MFECDLGGKFGIIVKVYFCQFDFKSLIPAMEYGEWREVKFKLDANYVIIVKS